MSHNRDTTAAPNRDGKVIVLGDRRSGKSSFICKAFHNAFPPQSYHYCIALEFFNVQVPFRDVTFELQLWDAPYRFSHSGTYLNRSLTRNARGVFFLVDLSNPLGVDAAKITLDATIGLLDATCCWVIVGAKDDVADPQCSVAVEALALERGMPYVAVSSKTGSNIQLALLQMALELQFFSHCSREQRQLGGLRLPSFSKNDFKQCVAS